ncbi:MAG: valine--tRNA ligase [Clostridia bacterium]|nr:valine--tRNA ligase [Clostridia bacterium]MDH7573603.1 valine--tRNA ligase [Clostridia bacterium]
MPKNLAATYDHRAVEKKWYSYWEDSGFFAAATESPAPPFCIVMPPPNVTGSLHLGHALDETLQDILTRWRRMQGYNALWLPGTDHAGIATQARVEEELAKEGLSRHDLGREPFLARVWDWKERYGRRITEQLRLLGASCDWSRERFTMDEGCSRAVREVFVRLYEKGLIYRGNYMINWCPKCHTVISDIEVEHEEEDGYLWHILYPLEEGRGHIIVATTRPETMLGDTAVAVHPDDDRYRHLVGRRVILPLAERPIPIIADAYVDPAFGSGAVKITPAHDPNDFEIGHRHGLEQIEVIDRGARMTAAAGVYAGMDRYVAREAVVRDLAGRGLLLRQERYRHSVGRCYRCGTVIEPLVSEQWFVRMEPLAEPARQAVLEGRVRFIPERFTRVFLNWLDGIRDWCISRQLWWGHRIPVWYCQDCGHTICRREDPDSCPACGSKNLHQDEDVLDTWFSSALWPFSTLGWPQNTPDLSRFYPTTVLVTGRDILFFWVARMIFMGLEFMGEVPFREVLIHGLVRDAEGRKMSKSLGNGVDPVEVIEKYGADSLRFMLVTNNAPGNDLRFNWERVEAARNFANKIWNAARFALLNLEDYRPDGIEAAEELPDRWILSRLGAVTREVGSYLEEYELGEAARVLYEFIWSEFCDWYLEMAKLRLYGEDAARRHTAQRVLLQTLRELLKLLHPFMPFLTEEIWHYLPDSGTSLMLQRWPVEPGRPDPAAEEAMGLLMEVIRGIRNIRGEMRLLPGRSVPAYLVAAEAGTRRVLEEGREYVRRLAQADPVQVEAEMNPPPRQAAGAVAPGVQIFVPLAGLIDFDRERERLGKELSAVSRELGRAREKLANPDFLRRAPEEVVARERRRAEELAAKEQALRERLAVLG